nr:unnamed protein product [Digitaria exilis]
MVVGGQAFDESSTYFQAAYIVDQDWFSRNEYAMMNYSHNPTVYYGDGEWKKAPTPSVPTVLEWSYR